MELLERVIKIESALPTLATRELVTQEAGMLRLDLQKETNLLRVQLHQEIGTVRAEFHKSMNEQTWKIITWTTGIFVTAGSALVAATYFIAKHA